MHRLLFFSAFFGAYFSLFSQHSNLPLNHEANLIYEKEIMETNIHTSFKPLIKSSVNKKVNLDSLLNYKFPNNWNNWYKRKLFSEHLIIIKGEDFNITASPIIHFSKGKETVSGTNTFTNTRGFIIEGDIGKSVSFYSSFAENQAIFPNYIDSSIRINKVVPGQGYARDFKSTGFDYAMASGYVAIKPAKHFTVQFGHGKHFIGNGYRSLLLSDNAFNYPFLRIQTSFWKLQYTNLYAEMQDINYFENNGLDNYDQLGYAKKYMSAHYLSVNVNSNLTISIFESVIWRANHAPGARGFDVNYLNPIALFRPLEFSINSPDNALVGINMKYKLPFKSSLYGQFVLDEFSLDEMKSGDDWFGSKYGYQIGAKMHDVFGLKNLTLQTEYNLVRPYTYAHHNPMQNYAHYNQPLAHPLGANFSEKLLIINYRKDRWVARAQLMIAKYGGKILNDKTSYGNDLYMSTGNFAEESGVQHVGIGRPDRNNDGVLDEFGMKMYQGNLTNINYFQLNVGYIINPSTNFKIDLGITKRNFLNEIDETNTMFYTISLKTDLFNHYYDF
ncbi:MAG: hypothetical protein H8E84_08500 [Flavobacteriales bacterium]|nr:hypothetical protein [Flavobacteriales bacterium]